MSEKEMIERISSSIVNLKFDEIEEACEAALQSGVPPYKIVDEGMAKGMRIVGEKYEANEYFLSELIVAGEIMKNGMKVVEPHLKAGDIKKLGKVVIGTVSGDLHDIGKNVVSVMLAAAGFDLIDLGVDVSTEKFVEAIREHSPDIVGMSSLLTVTMPQMEVVIEELKKAGLRSNVKVIIGGAPITPEYGKKIGADAAARDAVHGVNICRQWMETK